MLAVSSTSSLGLPYRCLFEAKHMGVILSRKVGGTIHGFYAARRKNFCISPSFTQPLSDHATSELGLTRKKYNQSQKVGGTKHNLSPGGKKVGGGHVPPSPTKLRPWPNKHENIMRNRWLIDWTVLSCICFINMTFLSHKILYL